MGPDRSMIINNEEVPGDMVRTLRYLIRGTRGYAAPPEGVESITELLRIGGIKRSKFPPGVRNLLGGASRTRAMTENVTRARRASDPAIATPMRQLPNVADSILRRQRIEASVAGQSPGDSSSSDDDQSGSGLDHLHEAMNLAEMGDHGAAWSSLCLARLAKQPRHLIKKAEAYCAQLRDDDDNE